MLDINGKVASKKFMRENEFLLMSFKYFPFIRLPNK